MADNHDWFGNVTGSAKEADQRSATDAQRRRNEYAKGAKSVILGRNDLHGEWDVDRVLKTTLGMGKGESRNITVEDLAAFKQNLKTAQSKFKKSIKGIKPQQVIDLSLAIDRERANQQIKMAVPTMATKGLVRYITNASKESKDLRHHVLIDFLAFESAAGGTKSPTQAANWLRQQPIAFDCDCGRHTFWYRYISTIGNFNAGRAETGYPKVRNPNLSGVGCKHILRVMAEISSGGTTLGFLTKQIEKARGNDSGNAVRKKTQAEIKADLDRLEKQKHRVVKTSDVRASDRQARANREAIKQAAKEAAKPPKKTAQATRKATVGKGGFNKAQRELLLAQGLTEATINMIEAAGKNNA
jgi:hypothetical protein